MGSISPRSIGLSHAALAEDLRERKIHFGAGFNSVVAMLFTLGAGCDGAFIFFGAQRRAFGRGGAELQLEPSRSPNFCPSRVAAANADVPHNRPSRRRLPLSRHSFRGFSALPARRLSARLEYW